MRKIFSILVLLTLLAENANYEYLMVGENLALGNFENDATLVQAWMESQDTAKIF